MDENQSARQLYHGVSRQCDHRGRESNRLARAHFTSTRDRVTPCPVSTHPRPPRPPATYTVPFAENLSAPQVYDRIAKSVCAVPLVPGAKCEMSGHFSHQPAWPQDRQPRATEPFDEQMGARHVHVPIHEVAAVSLHHPGRKSHNPGTSTVPPQCNVEQLYSPPSNCTDGRAAHADVPQLQPAELQS